MTPQEYYNLARNRVEYYHTVTEIDRARIEATQEYYRRQEQERAQLAKVANNRAKELLLSHLTKKQRQTFEKNNWFIVHGGKTDTKYRIRTTSYSGNIDVFTGDKVTATLCCHCSDALPIHDHHLAQKIGLEWDEERFLKLANRRAA